MFFTAADIARQIQGEVLGDGSVPLTGVAPADHAQRGDLTYAENEDYFARAEQSAASAILADGNFSSAKKVVIRARTLARCAWWVSGRGSGRASCSKAAITWAPTASWGRTRTCFRTSHFIPARRSANASPFTPARSSARMDSVTCSMRGFIAKCRRSATS